MDFVYDVACDLYGKGLRQGEMDFMQTCCELVRSAFALLLDTNVLYLEEDIVMPRLIDSDLMEQCAADEVSEDAGQEHHGDRDMDFGAQHPLDGQGSFEDLARDFILRQCTYMLANFSRDVVAFETVLFKCCERLEDAAMRWIEPCGQDLCRVGAEVKDGILVLTELLEHPVAGYYMEDYSVKEA